MSPYCLRCTASPSQYSVTHPALLDKPHILAIALEFPALLAQKGGGQSPRASHNSTDGGPLGSAQLANLDSHTGAHGGMLMATVQT